MAGKSKIPAPIDRPLSRAYLREFSGWSTAYPPGASEPTSLRIMENMMINRDGSVRVRPGLRYISFSGDGQPLSAFESWVGSHEAFYLDDGRKAYLFYSKIAGGECEPKVLVYQDDHTLMLRELDDPEVGFDVVNGIEEMRFSAGTTYVKYLQIDNKVFALSNAGEPMKMFHVGDGKWAKGLQSIEVPGWAPKDKPIVVHPEAAWINGLSSQVMRKNIISNPSFELNLDHWHDVNGDSSITRVSDRAKFGTHSMRLKALKNGLGSAPLLGDTVQPDARTNIYGIKAGEWYEVSAYLRLDEWGSGAKRVFIEVEWYKANDKLIKTKVHACNGMTYGFRRHRTGYYKAPPGAVRAKVIITLGSSVVKGSAIHIDGVMMERQRPFASSAAPYFDASMTPPEDQTYVWEGEPHSSPSTALEVLGTWNTQPTKETRTPETLISSTAKDNVYSFGYFYTFYNEIGESAPSQVTVMRTQRPVTTWIWETPNGSGEPSGTETRSPEKAADQLVVSVPEAVYDSAVEQGALGWNLYMLTWSDQDAVPVDALMIGQREFDSESTWQTHGWIRHDAGQSDWPHTMPVPNASTRFNYSDPSRGGQGIVAADRMVLVYDPTDAARIRWTSNEQGAYTNFTANRGGGYKTLTSGNLYVPAAVKLWQNPQSADTITVLCMGTDSYSTGYYMAPAQVAQQSETVNIMSFEETTATPGTVSPFGCEVLNNALYHPLDNLLMKSTASNYNINHKALTDQIDDQWVDLVDKHHIVSSQHDNRLYYLVHNPNGRPLEEGCWGNEIWVYDAASKEGNWSRLMIQGTSLRKVEHRGLSYMSITRPEGLFLLDPDYDRDDITDGTTLRTRFISWKMETNTQGANRAHDAWAHLQQIGVSLGNWQGTLRYGIKSWDINGKPVEISKVFSDQNPPDAEGHKFDIEDQLLIRRDLREWYFFAESVESDVVT